MAREEALDLGGGLQVAVGVPIANRTHVEAEALVGTLVNTLVMRCDLGGDPSFGDLLSRVQQTALDAYAHQDLPFEQLVEELRGPRDQNNSPLIRVLFNVLNTPAHHDALEGLSFEQFAFARQRTARRGAGNHWQAAAHGERPRKHGRRTLPRRRATPAGRPRRCRIGGRAARQRRARGRRGGRILRPEHRRHGGLGGGQIQE